MCSNVAGPYTSSYCDKYTPVVIFINEAMEFVYTRCFVALSALRTHIILLSGSKSVNRTLLLENKKKRQNKMAFGA